MPRPEILPALVDAGNLTPRELAWRERHHTHPALNWRIAGRDDRGNLVCWTILSAGRQGKREGFEWVCMSTLEPGGVTYASAKQPVPKGDR